MRELTTSQAIREAMAQEMRRDPSVFLMGEDVGLYGGAFGVTAGLLDEFGPERIRDTPISEAAIAGAAVGAALLGMRPIAEIQFSDFVTISMDQLVNQAAKIRYMYGGKGKVPMVLRTPVGSGTGAAAQHSQSLEAWLAHVPGLKVVLPSSPEEAKGLLISAIRDENPVVVYEHKLLYKLKGPVPEEPYAIPLGKARIARPGRDVTVVSWSFMVGKCLRVAERLAAEGIEVEVVDPRTINPLDREAIIASVCKTGRLVVVHESVGHGGFGGEIVATVTESEAFDYLDAPIRRVAGKATPIPCNPVLEAAAVPQEPDIEAAIRSVLSPRAAGGVRRGA